jgi:hypothetical protein
MQKLAWLLLLALPMLALSQSNSTNTTAQCLQCQKTFVATGKNIWVLLPNATKEFCIGGFSDARGLDVATDGRIFVADHGDKSIWIIDAACSMKTLVIRNDYLTTTWLNPLDIAYDTQNAILYVSMDDVDALWMTYSLPRQLIAKEKHVYALQLIANGSFSGSAVILSQGVDNGRDIARIRFINNTLWAVRKHKYVSRLVDGVWLDFIGVNEEALFNNKIASVIDVDPEFIRCGYLALVSDLDGQVFECSSQSNFSSCMAQCPNSLLSTNLFNSSASSTSSSSSNFLPFFDRSDCLDVQEDVISFSLGQNVQQSLNMCGNLLIPYSVAVDCECNLLVGTFGNQAVFSYIFNEAAKSLGSASEVLNFGEPVFKMVVFSPASCSAPNATIAPNATATPEPTSSAAPNATATPEPTSSAPNITATPEPSTTPIPTSTATPEPTATATPEPTATATPQPTTVRLARLRDLF